MGQVSILKGAASCGVGRNPFSNVMEIGKVGTKINSKILIWKGIGIGGLYRDRLSR
jgi:hypothetical protein